MIRLHPRPVPASVPSRLPALMGGLTLVATGLGALGLIAMSAQSLWPAPPSAAVATAPEVWLSNLAAPAPTRFAAADYAIEPLLPRGRPAVTVQRPVEAVAVAPVTEPVRVPQIAVLEGAPRVTPPRRQVPVAPVETAAADPVVAPADPLALAALQAPTRSLTPRPRPQIATAAPLPEPAPLETVTLASLPTASGLLASLLPQRRPETATRLASADLPDTLDEAPRASSLSVPALDEAIASADPCDSAQSRAIPRRAGRADDGSTVIGRLTGLGGSERDRAITNEVLAGNLPDFLRDLVPVTFSGSGANGQRTRVTICVTPDYLAVGSDRDFVRVPLGLPAAMQVAEQFDMVLPTTRMVDAIYAQATVRLSPSPMEPGAQMASTGYFLRHNATVEGQRSRAGGRLGQLVSGHKKDLVLTNRLNANPGRVAIYGWHRQGGSPIQPLSTVHGASYADYSHGIRLVSRRAFVNGRAVDLRDLLADSRLAGLVSSEGTITNRQMLAALR